MGRQNMKHGGEPPLSDHQDKTLWLDLSTGINPIAYPVEPLANSTWQELPRTSDLQGLLSVARKAYDVPAHMAIIAAPGTEAIIWQLPDALRGAVHIAGPTYSSHLTSWQHRNCKAVEADASVDWPTDRHLVVVNPNNPTGRVFETDQLIEFASKLEAGRFMIVDEAFMDCTPEMSIIPHLRPDLPIVVLRSFGKFFGLAGIRLGFAIGPHEILAKLNQRFGDWSINGPALKIGTAALADHEWQQIMRLHLRDRVNQLHGFLKRPDTIVGQTDLFLLYQHPNAQDLHASLAKDHIWTRVFPKHPNWIRFGVPGNIKDFSRLAQGFYDFFEAQRGT